MKRFISAVATFLAVMLVSALVVPLAACAPDNCKIKVVSMANLSIEGVSVSVSANGSEVASGTTNGEGIYELDVPNGTYSVKLGNLPKGYTPSESYAIEFSDDKKEVTLGVTSHIITGEDLPDRYFVTGDIMYDFEIATTYKVVTSSGAFGENTKVESSSLSLAQAFEGKRAVLLNFWYTGCRPCEQEFPAIMEAYSEYEDKIAIIGIDNYPTDTNALVESYALSHNVTYPIAMDSAGVCDRFKFNSTWPTSIMIDRYGIICEFHVGAVYETEFWREWFKKYTADNYAPNVNGGLNPDESITWEADKPADFGVEFTKNPEEISNLINKTGTPVSFTADASEYSWPWKIQGDSIVPTNSGHISTPAIIYASLYMSESAVLAFDYKLNCKAETDYFFVAVDGRAGIGTQTLMDSGEKDWRTGYAYISLEAGMHEISFTYLHTSNNEPDDVARVMVKNLRFITVDQMLATGTTLDIPYFTAREQNFETGGYKYYSDVYLAKTEDGGDGFYHVRNHTGADNKDPILMADLQHATPYFTNANASVYNNYISTSKCTFGNKNYLRELNSYNTWASNSDISGLVPVTEELKIILEALYNSENETTALHYNANGWLEFCAFYKHYGEGKSIGNPIAGLAPFCALTAHETTGNPNDFNIADFQKLIMPRGLLFRFTPDKSGVYTFSGANLAGTDKAGTDAWLYNDGMKLATDYYSPINYCGDDYYLRNMPDDFDFDNVNFTMHHYLESGKSYYLVVAFHTVETLGQLKFRIDYTGKNEVKYLTTATAGFYYQNADGSTTIPVYADVANEPEADGYYYASYANGTKLPIYCDFTDVSRLFNLFPISSLINIKPDQIDKPFDFTNYTMTYKGRTIGGHDYTDVMKKYYELSIEGKQKTEELYGLTQVTEELREVLTLFYGAQFRYDDDKEWLSGWLKACWYYDYTDADKPMPDTILWRHS